MEGLNIEEMDDSSETDDTVMSDEIVPEKHFIPREYQEEILECAKKENVIACLGTGTGKTYIAVMLIREMSQDIRKPLSEGGKRTVFLVPTVPLVSQQGTVLNDHTDLKVGMYYGALGIDFWNKEQWLKEFEICHVLVMTAEIFRMILHHGFLSLSQVNLIVFDECHRAVGNHPYTEIMRCFDTTAVDKRPKILGLTASILNGKCKPHKVEDSLKKLEKTLMSVARVAKNLLAYNKFGTKPRELITYYCNAAIVEEIPNLSSAFATARRAMMIFTDNSSNSMKKLKMYMTGTYEALTTLGPWCAQNVAMQFSEEVEGWLLNCEFTEQERKWCASGLDVLKTIAALIFSVLPTDDSALLYGISPKLKLLLDILRQFRLWEADNEMCSIIFVQKRITARILYQWLDAVSLVIPEYKFIRCNFVVGHGATSIDELKGMEMDTKKQKKIISEFYDKKFNLVIATSVIEEGLDVPQCNLVIRYDMPMDYRAYIQSKGRARAKKSLYIMMVCSTEKLVSCSDFQDYRNIEKILTQRCFDRQPPSQEDIAEHFDEDTILPPYMPVKEDGCPRITMSSAISIVNRYCSLLPTSTHVRLRPNYETKAVDMFGGEENFYQCKLYLPMNSPVKEAIVGEVMTTKRTANMAAALKACELLHKAGELDQNLLPMRQDLVFMSDEENEEEEEEDDAALIRKGKKGTKKRAKYYPKEIANALCGQPPSTSGVCYLYALNISVIDPLVPLHKWNDPMLTTRGFGILTTKLIPTIGSFPLFLHAGQAEVKLTLIRSGVSLSKEQLAFVELFHEKLFEDVLQVTENQTFNAKQAKSSYFVVPINCVEGSPLLNWTVDWDFLKSLHARYTKGEKCINFKFRKEDYVDAVVMDSYRDSFDEQSHFYVYEISEDLTPMSCMPGSTVTFQNFYASRYNATVTDKNQPLLRIFHVKNPLLIFPTYLTSSMSRRPNGISSKKDKSNRFLYFIPELITVHPFPATLWFKALVVPCILHRLNHLLLAEQLRVEIVQDFGIGKKDFGRKFCWSPIVLSENKQETMEMSEPVQQPEFGQLPTQNELLFHFDKHPKLQICDSINLTEYSGPELDTILAAFTGKHAADFIDLERLETIGDAFLKHASSEYMCSTYPNYNEGKLTALKMKEISNKNLVKLARARNLIGRLVATKFEPRVNFLAPGFVAATNLERAFAVSGIPEKYWSVSGLPNDLSSLSIQAINNHVNNLKNHFKQAEENNTPLTSFKPFRPLIMQHISDKAIADSMEALIGAYLVSGGYEVALLFMSWLGLKVMKDTYREVIREGISSPKDFSIYERFKQFEEYESPLLHVDENSLDQMDRLMKGLHAIEVHLGYEFKDEAYLLQAVTHPSYTGNRITDCYERLEFLGDAVLDYLVARYLFNDPKNFKPGEITDIKASLVNNSLLAELTVKYGFQKYLKFFSAELFGVVRRFVDKSLHMTIDETEKALMFEEGECEIEDEIQVPKVLADIFEALLGAVYLDSKRDLNVVWKVICNLMGREIEQFKNQPPKNPVRLLLEKYPLTVKLTYGEPKKIGANKFKVEIEAEGQVFWGIGANKKLARKAACKRAYRQLLRFEVRNG